MLMLLAMAFDAVFLTNTKGGVHLARRSCLGFSGGKEGHEDTA